MNTNNGARENTYYSKSSINYLFAATLLMVLMCGPALGEEGAPLNLPKAEGSKSFDLKIDQTNSQGIQLYRQGNFEKSVDHFERALNLAQQLRDPSQGILHYNLALSFHKSGKNQEATQQFYSARRFARGNQKILESELLRMHECGLNPSVPCEKKVPLEMNI